MTADQLLLWRHGRTASNASQRFQGHLDVPLDDVGQVQAKNAAEALAPSIGAAPCRIVSSDLSRAHDTALALGRCLGLPVTTDPALRELDLGRWQGLNHEEAIAMDPDSFAAWRAGKDVRAGGGETRRESSARVERAVRGYAESMDGGVLVVASHGGVLRGATQRLIGIEQSSPPMLGIIHNAHWARLNRHGDGWILDSYNIGPGDSPNHPEGRPHLTDTF